MSANPQAAREMIQRSGQQGVPVIVANGELIVGFDRPRLERLIQRIKQEQGPQLGLIARDAPDVGVEVGGTRPGSPADRAGFRTGDVLESIDGKPVRSLAELERLLPQLPRGVPLDVRVKRGDSTETLSLVL